MAAEVTDDDEAAAAPKEEEQDVETLTFRNLQSGFHSIRKRRSSLLLVGSSTSPFKEDEEKQTKDNNNNNNNNKVCLVNFIDPSSVSGSIVATTTTPSKTTSSQTPPKQPSAAPPASSSVSLYDRLSTIFERDYKNTLTQLPYQDVLRSKAQSIIESIQVQCVLTPGVFLTDDVLQKLSKDDHAATTWHEGPYCNVYLVACETLEEYRTKVKPSVQAFVSQIESTNKDGAYVIVYCPLCKKQSSAGADHERTASSASSGSSRVGSLASRIRQRMGRDTSGNSSSASAISNAAHASNSSTHSNLSGGGGDTAAATAPASNNSMHSTAASTNSADLSMDDNSMTHATSTTTASDDVAAAAAFTKSTTAHLTKVQKELCRRFAADFAAGHVCTLSTLLMEQPAEDAVESSSPLQKLEWSHFMKSLGGAVVEGFQERCRRLDEVLRKMDSQRGGNTTPTKKKQGSSTTTTNGESATTDGFNLSRFFLIKESLAFTYEQMNLPAEALMQYNELRALLPDIRTDKELISVLQGGDEGDLLSGIEGAETRRRSEGAGISSSSSAGADDIMSQLASASDIVAFRQGLSEITDLRIIAPAMEEYIYGRETSLLFQIGDPVEVIRRSLHFVSIMFDFRTSQINNLSPEARRERSIEMERWAFKFCWDLKRAADAYISMEAVEDANAAMMEARGITGKQEAGENATSSTFPAAASMVTIGKEVSSSGMSSVEKRPTASMETFARHVCDVLGYARLRLIRLADLVLAEDNIMTRIGFEAVPADIRKPWSPWVPPSNVPERTPNKYGIRNLRSGESFLEDAFESKESFQSRFLDVMKVAIALNTFAGRYRCAARLNLDVVEIFLRRGEIHEAVNALQNIAAVYARDQWMACNFLLLFRLAGFQREIGSPSDYLTTLVQCFHGQMSVAAPPKALDALQTDLEAVTSTESTSGIAFVDPQLFAPLLELRDQRQMPGAAGRKLARKVYNVGDHAGILLALTSHLPRSIDDVTIKVDLVPYHVYVSCLEDSVPVSQDDVCETLSLGSPVTVEPGKNDFVFEWIPILSGQFIVAMVEIEWRGIQFTYKSREVLKPTIRVDILPREPTQSIVVKPLFLLPGHEQPLRIEFSSGSDDVKGGELQLNCSPGLLALPPDEDSSSDKWSSTTSLNLPPCPPGETVVLTASVRSSSDSDSHDSPPTVQVKVSAQYQYLPPELSGGNVKEQGSACSENTVETVVETLEESALTVSDVIHLTTYAVGRSLLGISLECHTPTPFVLKSWKLTLPSYLELEEDMNASLADTIVANGEQVYFGFHCKHCLSQDSKSSYATLVVDVENEYGSLFSEKLNIRVVRISMPKMELPDIQNVPIKIRSSSMEGNVGSPVELDYVVDTTAFANWKGRVSYCVDTDSADWFVSGNTQGVVDTSSSSFSLQFVAIPTRPGAIPSFPTLSLSLEGDDLEKPIPLTAAHVVDDGSRQHFRALAPPLSSSVAFLSLYEV